MVDIYILFMYYSNMRSRDRLIIQTSQRIQMAKTRKLTATFADGLILKRTTARTYTHVVIGKDKWGNHYEKWCGRPDLVAKQTARLTTYKVGEVTNDPWAN